MKWFCQSCSRDLRFCVGDCGCSHEEEGYDSKSGSGISCGRKAAGETSYDDVRHQHNDSLEYVRITEQISQSCSSLPRS